MPKTTKAQRQEIIQKYQDGSTTTILAKEYNVSSQTIQYFLKTRGVKCRRRKYTCNEHYFDHIDTAEKAYWLGYIFAEGSLDIKTHALAIKIGAFDQEHLYKFRDAIGSNHPIKTVKDRNAVKITIGSKILSKVFQQYNFGPDKAKSIILPDLDPVYVQYFILGFFDGDGWISVTKTGAIIVGFSSCSRLLIQSFRDWFTHQLGEQRGSIIHKHLSHIPNQNDNFCLQYGGKQNPLSILSTMYKNTVDSLNRKRNKAGALFEQYKCKFGD